MSNGTNGPTKGPDDDIDAFLTEERQARIWDDLRKQLSEEPQRVRSKHRLWRLQLVGGLVAVVLGLFLVVGKTEGPLYGTQELRGVGVGTNLFLNFRKENARLSGGATPVEGKFKMTNQTPQLSQYSVRLLGTDSQGVEGVLSGTLTLTNVAGVSKIKHLNDSRGGRLEGIFVFGNKTNAVSLRFAPF